MASRSPVLRVGLTGGIGAGKSTVSDRFAARGVPVIDTDLIARELVAPGSPALAEIAARFGGGVLTPDGSLDRTKLRREVFSDNDARSELESILHPRIREEVQNRVAGTAYPYCIVVIPLLVETEMTDLVDRILVVDIDPELQLRRAAARDGNPDQVAAIMRTQATRERRLAAADDVIDNNGDPEHLDRQVELLHRLYLALAPPEL